MGGAMRVIAAGPAVTVQDRGRAGHASLGVARAGALDRMSLAIGNRLLGNPDDVAGLEIVLGGFAAVTEHDAWIVLSGALAPATVAGRSIDRMTAVRWPAGTELRVGVAERGARVYLSVRGGIAAPLTLGSRSTDTMSGLGPAPIVAGDTIAIGENPATPIPPNDLAPWDPPTGMVTVRVSAGPRLDWFASGAWEALTGTTWRISAATDRVGARLDSEHPLPLVRTRLEELLSEGTVPGSIQVPPNGAPVVLLADGPTTGGYPVIAVVADADLDRIGQARPGDSVRFRGA